MESRRCVPGPVGVGLNKLDADKLIREAVAALHKRIERNPDDRHFTIDVDFAKMRVKVTSYEGKEVAK